MVVWDDNCASESRIPSWPTVGPTVITYYFNAADVRRVTDQWHAIKSYARRYKPSTND